MRRTGVTLGGAGLMLSLLLACKRAPAASSDSLSAAASSIRECWVLTYAPADTAGLFPGSVDLRGARAAEHGRAVLAPPSITDPQTERWDSAEWRSGPADSIVVRTIGGPTLLHIAGVVVDGDRFTGVAHRAGHLSDVANARVQGERRPCATDSSAAAGAT